MRHPVFCADPVDPGTVKVSRCVRSLGLSRGSGGSAADIPQTRQNPQTRTDSDTLTGTGVRQGDLKNRAPVDLARVGHVG